MPPGTELSRVDKPNTYHGRLHAVKYKESCGGRSRQGNLDNHLRSSRDSSDTPTLVVVVSRGGSAVADGLANDSTT